MSLSFFRSLGLRTICLLTPTLAFLNGPLSFSKAFKAVNSIRKFQRTVALRNKRAHGQESRGRSEKNGRDYFLPFGTVTVTVEVELFPDESELRTVIV